MVNVGKSHYTTWIPTTDVLQHPWIELEVLQDMTEGNDGVVL